MTREIVSVNLRPSSRDLQFTTQILDELIHVQRFGSDGDAGRAAPW